MEPISAVAGLNVGTKHDVSLLARNIDPARDLSIAHGGSDSLGYYGVGQQSTTVKTLNVNTAIRGWRGRLRTAFGVNIYAQSSSDISGSDTSLALGVTVPNALDAGTTQAVTGTSTYGWFFEPRLTLSQRFFLTPGFRLDGGTANGGQANVSGLPAKLSFASLFPKISFSWVALDRQDGSAQPLFGILTLLRPRLTIGSAGVQPSPTDKLRLLSGWGRCPNGEFSCNSSDDTLLLRTLGNAQLRPERSSELEFGFDAEVWHDRASLQVTRARRMQHDAIISVPVAPSVLGSGNNISLNIGEIRNTSTEIQASIRPVEMPLISWQIGGYVSRNENVVLQLDRNSTAFFGSGFTGSAITSTRIAVGYPLFGRWALPIRSYADVNGNGRIEPGEIRLGDTAVFLGRQDPGNTAALNTDLTLFNGRLGIHANFSHTGQYSQINAGSNSLSTFLSAANDPNASLAQQAYYVAAVTNLTPIGLAQTVSSWEFNSFSVNYAVPIGVARYFRAHTMTLAVQGSNLGLWTNYRGKDPNVNAYPNGNSLADGGQLPRPRTWSLQVTLGN
jgi:hypothetical protein